jgi:acyl-coenzyme A thioesterase PaaI-like protein
MEQRAFQDDMLDNSCYGCGPINENGLRIKSYWDGDESICTFTPRPYHTAGPKHFVNGGLISTLIDCHCVCTAIAYAYRKENRAIGSDPRIWCVTASLKVNYLKPTPINKPVFLRARINDTGEKKTIVSCSLSSDGVECARGEVVAVRVSRSWRESK